MPNLIRTLHRALENQVPGRAVLSIIKQACISSTLKLVRYSLDKNKTPELAANSCVSIIYKTFIYNSLESLAVEGGFSEPLSKPQFPANREINREFCEFGRSNSEEKCSIALNTEAFWLQIPIECANLNRELLITHQGFTTP
jgi:hypothetical protein